MEKIRFIVRARVDADALTGFLAQVEADPALELVDAIGPASHPHTAVVATNPEDAPAVEQRLLESPNILVERDRPLSLSTPSGGTAAALPRDPERKANAQES